MSTVADETVYEARLRPHRSLDVSGFRLVMLICCGSAIFSSIPFILFGAWPVAGFYGLDILALFVAFKVNYRRARAEQQVRVSYVEFFLRKVTHRGEAVEWRFNPFWARLSRVEDAEYGTLRLSVSSRGQDVPIGEFLSAPQRRDLADALHRALAVARRGPNINP